MDPITEHHYLNIANGKSVENEDGSLSTVKTIIVEIDGVETLIPTVWDGQIVEDVEMAVRFAKESGVKWPSAEGPDAVEKLQALDDKIHKNMMADTKPEDARMILNSVNKKEGFGTGGLLSHQGSPEVSQKWKDEISSFPPEETTEIGAEVKTDGGVLTLTQSSTEGEKPMWVFTPDVSSLALDKSPRPRPRPDNLVSETSTEKDQRDKLAGYSFRDKVAEEEWANLVASYEKNPNTKEAQAYFEYLNNSDPRSEATQYASAGYALGGLATATKGITTEAGLMMAKKNFQLDDKKADTNGDGTVSARESVIGEAVQRNELIDEDMMKLSDGGMACGCGGGAEDCTCGAMTDGFMGYDEISGNPIPLGSGPENVRDDIDAKLSTDEYVLPSHVVKWHGLKAIQLLQDEAEMGLMGMQMQGLIHHTSDTEEVDEDTDEIDEGVEVEVVSNEVDDQLDDMDEPITVKPKTSPLPGMLKKQKYAFMV
jgi:hypothetical protein